MNVSYSITVRILGLCLKHAYLEGLQALFICMYFWTGQSLFHSTSLEIPVNESTGIFGTGIE